MIGPSKLASSLTVMFAVSLLAILVQLFLVLRRRRRLRRQSIEDGGNSFYSSPKELLHIFCWENQSRIEPNEAPAPTPSPQITTEVDDVFKWHVLYGQSRILFTIKEEEREGLDSENCSSSENGTRTKRAVCTEEVVGVLARSLPVVAVKIDVDDATPFSTPCASPPYYTPLPSPTREK